MRVCLIYDCLYPYTIGGAERWYRALADALVEHGHEVTYITRKQWPDGTVPDVPGVTVVAVSPGGELYSQDGRRRIGPPIRFGAGVFRHLVANRGRYDAIHMVAFPYFSVIAVRLAARGVEVGVDWFEVWSKDYWRRYLGRVGGAIGYLVQRLCVRMTPRAFVFSEVHGRRLEDEGFRGELVRLSGLYAGSLTPRADAEQPREPLVLFAGRQIPEKQAHLVPAAVAAARERVPGLRGLVLGDGPEHARVLEAVRAAGAEQFVEVPGFVAAEEVHSAFARASCHVLPSVREGYGLVVIEAAAAGAPSVVIAGEDNAATELIEDGVNGFVAASASELADAIVAVHEGGAELRASTVTWFRSKAPDLQASASAALIAGAYDDK